MTWLHRAIQDSRIGRIYVQLTIKNQSHYKPLHYVRLLLQIYSSDLTRKYLLLHSSAETYFWTNHQGLLKTNTSLPLACGYYFQMCFTLWLNTCSYKICFRDPRGFAVKFYTEEGNWDLVGNNTPIFFMRDPILFPSFIHTQKRNPQTNLKVILFLVSNCNSIVYPAKYE